MQVGRQHQPELAAAAVVEKRLLQNRQNHQKLELGQRQSHQSLRMQLAQHRKPALVPGPRTRRGQPPVDRIQSLAPTSPQSHQMQQLQKKAQKHHFQQPQTLEHHLMQNRMPLRHQKGQLQTQILSKQVRRAWPHHSSLSNQMPVPQHQKQVLQPHQNRQQMELELPPLHQTIRTPKELQIQLREALRIHRTRSMALLVRKQALGQILLEQRQRH